MTFDFLKILLGTYLEDMAYQKGLVDNEGGEVEKINLRKYLLIKMM